MSKAEVAAGTIVEIRKKAPVDWGKLLRDQESQHWRKLRVTIQLREKLHAGKPKQLDAAKAMLNARGLEDAIEAVNVEDPAALASAAEKVVDEGVCEFHRRAGKPGCWFPSNNLKAMLKENWSVLGYRMDARPRAKRKDEDGKKAKPLQGSRGALAEGVFVVSTDPADRDWIYLGEKPDGIDQSVAHIVGPKGPMASIKRNEYLIRPKLVFEIHIAHAIEQKLPDESLADTLVHASEHGIGANRSQGYGRFDVLSVEEFE